MVLKSRVMIGVLVLVWIGLVGGYEYDVEVTSSLGDGNNSGLDVSVSVEIESNSAVINVDVDVDYVNDSDISCLFYIDGSEYGSSFDAGDSPSFDVNLSGDNYEWMVECTDGEGESDSDSGDFDVKDFVLSLDDDFFLSGEDVSGEVEANGGDIELVLIKPDGTEVDLETFNNVDSVKDFAIDSDDIDEAGSYSIKVVLDYYSNSIELLESFEVGSIDVDFDSTAKYNEDVTFNVTTENIDGSIFYHLWAGNFEIVSYDGDKSVDHSFGVGTFAIQLRDINIDGKSYPTISFGNLVVSNEDDDDSDNEDNENPDIDLIFPDWEEEISSDEIEFSYEASDNEGIKNCSFEIYNATKTSSGSYKQDELIFPLSSSDKNLALDKSVNNNDKIKVRLVDFDEGYYIWEVTCFDDAGNDYSDYNPFVVDFDFTKKILTNNIDYDRRDEVEDLIDKINSFLEKEENFGVEERKVLEILGLSKKMQTWKKRVIQIDSDFTEGLSPTLTAEEKVKRTEEIFEEIEEIKDGIILDIRSVDSYQFSKSSLDLDLGEVIKEYIGEGENSKSFVKSLVNYNEGLQKDLAVDVEAWKLELEYLDGVREIVLVNKNLDINSDEEDLLILEVISEEKSGDFKLVSGAEKVSENIYSVDVKKLEDGNLVYYFEKGFSLKEVEEMESVLFGEGSVDGGISLTGMFSSVGNGFNFNMFSFFWFPLILFIGYICFLGYGRVRIEGWKKEPGVEEMVRLINETKRIIQAGNVTLARANYKKMGEIYKALPVKCRDFFYKEIKRIHLAINKKDVLGLIREYEAAKDSKRNEDAVLLHKKINLVYKNLPKKFQEKVYARLVKREFK